MHPLIAVIDALFFSPYFNGVDPIEECCQTIEKTIKVADGLDRGKKGGGEGVGHATSVCELLS